MAAFTSSPRGGLVIPPVRAARLMAAAATLWLVIAYVWVVWRRGAFRVPERHALLIALGAAQIGLHWALRWSARSPWRLTAYLLLQSALLVAFGRIGRSDPWMYQLGILLLAEAVLVLASPRAHVLAAALAVAAIVALSAVLFGPWTLVRALMHTVPMAVSIAGFGVVFHRLARSEEESKGALAALDTAHRRLVDYAAELERLTLAAERQRLARELHDTLAQGLVGLTLQLEAVEAHLARGDAAKAMAIVRGARDRARGALADARAAITDLRDGSAAPLADALREEAERFTSLTGVPCTLAIQPGLALADDAAAHAIRCVAEGLSNVARHARARAVEISVAKGGDAVVLELSDDGVGFDALALEARPGHFGLVGLRERATLAGGRLEIASRPGAGTTLRLRLPVVEAEVAA